MVGAPRLAGLAAASPRPDVASGLWRQSIIGDVEGRGGVAIRPGPGPRAVQAVSARVSKYLR